MNQRFKRRDNKLKVTKTLPGSATTVYSDPLNFGISAKADFLAEVEMLIEAPACAVGQLADGETVNYFLQDDDNSDFSSPRALTGNIITQTGASGAGAAAAERRVRPPTDMQKYVRLGMVKTGSTNASSKTATLSVLQ